MALSASAVAAVYMAGYLRTQSADASMGAPTPPAAAAAADAPTAITVPAPTSIPTLQPFVQRQAPGAVAPRPTQPPRAPTPPSQIQSSTTAGHFKDGSYSGQGTSRRGDVWVSVQVQDGRITNVAITRSTLQYPLRDIANLPSQVVQRQSAQVDVVSRATYSSIAFRGAVSQALASAAA